MYISFQVFNKIFLGLVLGFFENVLNVKGDALERFLRFFQDRFQWDEWPVETDVYFTAEKYCRLLKEENGFPLLEDLIGRTTHLEVKRFAKIALEGSVIFLERNDGLSDASDYLEGWECCCLDEIFKPLFVYLFPCFCFHFDFYIWTRLRYMVSL